PTLQFHRPARRTVIERLLNPLRVGFRLIDGRAIRCEHRAGLRNLGFGDRATILREPGHGGQQENRASDHLAGPLVGSHASAPARNFLAVYCAASAAVSCFECGARWAAFAPAPVEPYSA